MLIKGDPGCPSLLPQFPAVLAPLSAAGGGVGGWLEIGTLEPALLSQVIPFSFSPGWASVTPSTLLPWTSSYEDGPGQG